MWPKMSPITKDTGTVTYTTPETPVRIIFDDVNLKLPWDLRFSAKPGEETIGKDYVSNHRKKGRSSSAHESQYPQMQVIT